MAQMTIDEAITHLRRDPGNRDRILDSYLDENLQDAGERFSASGEFAEVRRLLGGVEGKTVVDLGAGSGIASFAFCKCGAGRVLAVEPDASDLVGRGACAGLVQGMRCEILEGVGEHLPIADASADVMYCRQVLHHTQDLKRVMTESFRVLRPGGKLLCCREHVVDDDQQLAEFLANHPVHQLAGGENAFSLETYEGAIRAAGFIGIRSMSKFVSVISAYPEHRTAEALAEYPVMRLKRKFGTVGGMLAHLPGAKRAVVLWLERDRTPGRLYTFFAIKPG